LLMGASGKRPRWFEVGASLIVVDTLVHNFLHRTGILDRVGAAHPYGPGCYRPGGCSDVLRDIATTIDAREFNPSFPNIFPRFVQHSIWRYCAAQCLDICNGNQIDDRGQTCGAACTADVIGSFCTPRPKTLKNGCFSRHLTTTVGCVTVFMQLKAYKAAAI
jgi:hypothetical protein